MLISSLQKALKNVDLHFNVLFVAFDLEEKGSFGSKAYVKELQKTGKLQNIAAVINIEMLGYDSDNDAVVQFMSSTAMKTPLKDYTTLTGNRQSKRN